MLTNDLSAQVQYVRNDGQWDDHILYKAEFGGGLVFVERGKLTYVLSEADQIHLMEHQTEEGLDRQPILGSYSYQVEFPGSSREAVAEGIDPSTSYNNYFNHDDPQRWRSHVPLFRNVLMKEFYEDVDLRLHSRDNLMEYDFIVHPGADVSEIAMRYHGIENISIINGQLHLETPLGVAVELAPVVFQETEYGRNSIRTRFVERSNNEIGFEIMEAYDQSLDLIIDPVLVFSTYTGSLSDNWGFSATYDDEGNLYGAGMVSGEGYPVNIGAYDTIYSGGVSGVPTDIGITKYTADGTSLVYSTYLGGSGNEIPHSLIVNNNGELIIYGTTGSADYPVTANAYDISFNGGTGAFPFSNIHYPNGSDIVITKMNIDGSNLLGSTYFGGSGNDGLNITGPSSLEYNYGDFARGDAAIGDNNEIFISSCTFSDDIEVGPGSFQSTKDAGLSGLIAEFSDDLSTLNWATYLGGSQDDAAFSIELSGNELVIGGGTASPDMPGMVGYNSSYNGGQADGFLLKLSVDGTSSTGGTYLGTDAYDQVYFIEVDRSSNIIAYGQSLGDYDVTPGTYSVNNGAQFVHSLDNTLTTNRFSTVFGSEYSSIAEKRVNISPTAFLVDNCNNIYAIGWGGSVNNGYNTQTGTTFNMELTFDALFTESDGSDFYLIVLEGGAEGLLYATYYGELGGRGDHVDGGTSRFDKNGFVYHASCASCGGTQGFPTTQDAWADSNGSFNCNMGSFKLEFDFAPLEAEVDADPISGCPPLTVQFSNFTNQQGEYYFWDFDDGDVSTQENPVHVFDEVGVYDIQLIIIDSTNCIIADTAYTQVIVTDSLDETLADFDADTRVCGRTNVFFENLSSNANNFLWDFGDGSTSAMVDPVHNYLDAGTYTVTLIADPGSFCSDTATSTIIVSNSDLQANFEFSQSDCNDTTGTIQFTDLSTSSQSILGWEWDFGDGTISNEQNPMHNYPGSGTYDVVLTVTDSTGCSEFIFQEVLVSTDLFEANFNIIPNCNPFMFGVQFEDLSDDVANVVFWFWEFGDGQIALGPDPVHFYGAPGTYNATLTVTNDLGCTGTLTQSVDVFVSPVNANFTADSLECNNPEVSFTNITSSSDSVVAWVWDFGDGNSSDLENPTHEYDEPGFYTATLTAISSSGCESTITLPVNIPNLIVDFDILLPAGCSNLNLPIQFNIFGTTSSGVSGATWDFGDGTVEPGFSTFHTYTETGDYIVEYIISNSEGCVDTSTHPITISDSLRIEASYEFNACGFNELQVDFDLDISSASGIETVLWDFQDGTTLEGETAPSHQYLDTGTYLVEVFVETVDGCTATDIIEVEVTVENVNASFQFEPPPCNTNTVEFMNTTFAEVIIVSYNWNFGDGNTSTQSDPTHTYTGPGSYAVELTVESEAGCTYIARDSVTVIEVSTDLPDSLGICAGESVLLPLTATFGENIVWDPAGPLNDPNILQPLASPETTTVFTVMVEEVLANGDTCVQYDTVVVEVFEENQVDAMTDQYIAMTGEEVNLSATSGFETYLWDPAGNLDDPTSSNPVATITGDVTYQVIVSDENGCLATDTVNIIVEDVDDECALESLFVPTAFSPNNDGQNDEFRIQIQGSYDRFELRIHDRWGGLIFETDDISAGWDGRHDGRLLSTDAFGYFLVIYCNDDVIQKQGNITLVR